MHELLRDYPEVMTLPEVCDVVRATPHVVRELARTNELPAVKWGREWRFLRMIIESHVTGTATAKRGGLLQDWPSVLTADEVAQISRSTVRQVQQMAAAGHVRAFKVGAEWRFLREVIIQLLDPGRTTSS
ncbi:helix-turn-helix domain-containing protein [Streptomyces sp. NPDC090442]|uniref:helix-turn-helix domain-containing protein n=1 Tax=Streptomyces sp. NPDC090442 TaxID=3365962 RepID=UPI0038202F99